VAERTTRNIIIKRYGFVGFNIDYLWRNYNTNIFMMLQEKTHVKLDSGENGIFFNMIL